MVGMSCLLRLGLGAAVAAAAVAAAAAAAAVGAAAARPLAVPVAAPVLVGFHGDTLGNAEIGHGCDWPGVNDCGEVASAALADCVATCNAESACTHFVFHAPGGRCYLKARPVTAAEAALRWEDADTVTCGLLHERLQPATRLVAREELDDDDDDDVVVTTPTPSPAPSPAGFHGATLGNAVVGHNCDWPGVNDFVDGSATSPSHCLSYCNMYQACTHFVYVITVGSSGWCFLKGGQVTAEEATLWSPSSTTYTCGLLPERLVPTPSPAATPTATPTVAQLAPTPSPTAAPTQASPLDDPSDASPTTTPALDNPSDTPSNKTTTCNVHKEDCEDTKAAIASRYLNKRCLPRKGNGLLAMSAAALEDAFAAIEAYDCCVRDDDRAKLLSVALLLVVSDTCVALDAAPLPTQTVTAGPTNSTTVESPQNEPDVPPVDLTINAFGALGVLSGDLAMGATATTQTSRRQVGAKARNSVTLDVSNYEDPHQRACCHDNFTYDNQGCCAGWCWHLADIMPFFTLKMCCSDYLTPFELTCPA